MNYITISYIVKAETVRLQAGLRFGLQSAIHIFLLFKDKQLN